MKRRFIEIDSREKILRISELASHFRFIMITFDIQISLIFNFLSQNLWQGFDLIPYFNCWGQLKICSTSPSQPLSWLWPGDVLSDDYDLIHEDLPVEGQDVEKKMYIYCSTLIRKRGAIFQTRLRLLITFMTFMVSGWWKFPGGLVAADFLFFWSLISMKTSNTNKFWIESHHLEFSRFTLRTIFTRYIYRAHLFYLRVTSKIVFFSQRMTLALFCDLSGLVSFCRSIFFCAMFSSKRFPSNPSRFKFAKISPTLNFSNC